MPDTSPHCPTCGYPVCENCSRCEDCDGAEDCTCLDDLEDLDEQDAQAIDELLMEGS